MVYISRKDKAKIFIEKSIIPAIKENDLDYCKVLAEISNKFSLSRATAAEILTNYNETGKILIINNQSITIPDSEVINYLKETKDREARLKEMDREMHAIESLTTRQVEEVH